MAGKRQATTELTHDNWDQEDPSEREEMGTFQAAPKNVLEKRVIRTAKRRTQASASGDEAKKSVFSGFGGFNKAPPSSFDFLKNLANGAKSNQDQSASQTTTSSPLNTSINGANGGLFGMPMTSSTPSKSTFGMAGSTFGSATSTSSSSSLFSTTVNKTSNTMFKGPSTELKSTESTSHGTGTSITTSANANKSLFSVSNQNKNTPEVMFKGTSTELKSTESTSHGTGTSITTSANANKSLFSVSNQNKNTPEVNKNVEKPKDENKMRYYSKLRGLNEAVLEWIKKHVQETPLCILSPIFKDYEKYVKEIQDEYNSPDDIKKSSGLSSKDSKSDIASATTSALTTSIASDVSKSSGPNLFSGTGQEKTKSSEYTLFSGKGQEKTKSSEYTLFSGKGQENKSSESTLFSGKGQEKTKSSEYTLFSGKGQENKSSESTLFSGKGQENKSSESTLFSGKGQEKTSPFGGATGGFSFGAKPANSATSTAGGLFGTNTNSGGLFGTNTNSGGLFGTSTTTTNSASPFGSTSNGTSSFSFGTGKPFSFNSSVQQSQQKPAEEATEDADDNPPKVEYTPIVEENSVLEKKCKVFVKKDGNFIDKGVGTLYVKKVEGSEKHQLLVRANTTLGNVMLNLILSADTPTQRLGKNNVMMVCIPTPDTKPPPVPVLIRVKTSEEADQLLESLNKFKG